jgi:hypothetical protein
MEEIMNQGQGTEYRGPLMSPPQQFGETTAEPSNWPTVLGIIMIVIASLGLLQNACGGVASLFMPSLMSGLAQSASPDDPMIAAQVEMSRRFMVWNVINALVMIVLGIVLLSAGIGVFRRRRKGIVWARIWAVCRILWSMPASYLGYRIAVESFKAMEAAAAGSEQPMPPGFGSMMQTMGAVGVIVGIIFYSAFPLFLLIWFSRAKIRAEAAQWSD